MIRMNKLDRQAYLIIKEYSSRLAKRGYITAHGGNISIRSGNIVWITRHAASLENLRPEDIVRIYIDRPTGHDLIASTEAPIHLRIYRETQNLAVLHAHPPYSVVLSFFYDEIIPYDSEAYHVLRKVPIVEGSPGSEELAYKVANALKSHHAVIVRAHGVFTASKFVDIAYQYMCMVEHSAEIIYHVELFKTTHRKFIKPRIF